METATASEQDLPIFYVGQHETNRSTCVSASILQQAQACGVLLSHHPGLKEVVS